MMGAASSAAATSPVVLEDGVAAADSITFSTTPAANTLILFFGQRGGSDVALPSGYTLIAQRTGTNCRFLCAYKIAAGSETNVTSNSANVVGYAFASVNAVLDVTGTVGTSGSISVSIAGITPANPSLVFLVAASNNDCTSVSQNGTGWTEVFNSVTELSSNKELVVWRQLGSGVATDTVSVTFDNSPLAGVQFSIRF
jgi:hypothetical protein